MVSALMECATLAEDTARDDDGWVPMLSPRRAPAPALADLVAEKKARLRMVAAGMTGQVREGDLSAMVAEHDEFALLRARANGETLD